MTSIPMPEKLATLQVVAVQNLTGRQHPHVRVFGYRVGDEARTIVEVALEPADAMDLIAHAGLDKEFPEIEVTDRAVIKILTTAGIDVVHLGKTGDNPFTHPASTEGDK